MAKSKAVVILGMHRSGTSALGGMIAALGADMGAKLEAASPDNEKGYYENADVVEFHEKLLGDFGSSWSDLRSMPDGWEKATPFAEELETIIRRNFGEASLWAIKDPRMCRLMPMWTPILAKMDCEPVYVIMTRRPAEVAMSLQKRNGFSMAKSFSLWLSHNLESVKWSDAAPRVFITYDQLLSDWRSVAEKIAKGLHIVWPVSVDEAAPVVDEFLSPQLRHHKQTEVETPPLVSTVFDAMTEASETGEDSAIRENLAAIMGAFAAEMSNSAIMAEVEKELRAQIALKSRHIVTLSDEVAKLREGLAFAESLAYERETKINNLESEIERMAGEISGLKDELRDEKAHLALERKEKADLSLEINGLRNTIDGLLHAIDEIYNSSSWRYTAPLRKISKIIRGG